MPRILINQRDQQHPPVWSGPHFQVISYDHEKLTHYEKNEHFKHAVEPQYIVCLVTRGAISYKNQTSSKNLQAGTLYFVAQPSQVITALPKNLASAQYYWVCVKGKMAIESIDYLTRRFGYVHEYLELDDTKRIFNRLIQTIKDINNKHVVSVAGFTWFHQLLELIETNYQRIDSDLSKAPSTSALIGMDCMTFKDYAHKLGYSPSHLSRELKKSWGKSPGKTLRHMRLDEAARLFKSTNLSAAEIGHQVGYNSASSFNRAFSIRFGMTPIKYKKSNTD